MQVAARRIIIGSFGCTKHCNETSYESSQQRYEAVGRRQWYVLPPDVRTTHRRSAFESSIEFIVF